VAKSSERGESQDLTTLVGEVIRDAETLIGQQFDLLRSEIRQEVHQARDAAVSLGTGAALIATGGFLGALATVHAVSRATKLPLWASYGLVGGLVGGAGLALAVSGRRRAERLSLVPEQTVEALKENLSWAKDQATPTT